MDPFDVETVDSGFNIIFRRLTPVVEAIIFHCHSVWLFTSSDLKTIVGPSFVFGAANAMAGVKYGLESPKQALGRETFRRLPLVLLWIWMNLLPFTINNQKNPDAIKEDEMNKPWRTLPSRRMTPRQAERLMLALYPLAVGSSLLTGGFRQSVGLVVLGAWYNNFDGGDTNCFVRNLINACGYVCFTSGAMEVALGFPLPLETRLVRWFGVVAAIIFTTVHLQDMYDQIGDSMRRRKTVPLVIGDVPARWTIAIPMVFWGSVCPCFWNGGTAVLALSLLLAVTVAARSLLFTSVEGDRLTFKIWNAWMTLVFVLPLTSQGTPRIWS
jgi:UbiA prenyltransferase family